MLIRVILIFLLFYTNLNAEILENCKWLNKDGKPCLTITKTPNTSEFNQIGVNKIIINKQDIVKSGALDVNDILKLVIGLDVFQSGQKVNKLQFLQEGLSPIIL